MNLVKTAESLLVVIFFTFILCSCSSISQDIEGKSYYRPSEEALLTHHKLIHKSRSFEAVAQIVSVADLKMIRE